MHLKYILANDGAEAGFSSLILWVGTGINETQAMYDTLPAAVPLILSGRIASLGHGHARSAIDKSPVKGPWRIERTGLVGDEQADERHHGGPEKALHHYPFEHYETWRASLGDNALLHKTGAFGENISTSGWTEETVHVGDIIRFGGVLLQVSQARQPCWKLNVRLGSEGIARRMQSAAITGWYYRVLEHGCAEPGALLTLEHRPQPRWPLSRTLRLLYRDLDAYDELQDMAGVSELSDGWRRLAARRSATKTIEDWTVRLHGGGA